MIIHWRGEAIISVFQKHFRFLFSCRRAWQVLLLISLLLPVSFTFAAQISRIAVLFPESSSRVSQVYESIIRGMQQKGVELSSRELRANTSGTDIQKWLDEQNSQAIILLGKKGLQFSKKLHVTIPVITGAHVGIQTGRSAVTLAADPKQLLQMLKKLKPDVRRVSVIYKKENSGWLIAQARLAAKRLGIRLNAVEVDSIRESGLALKNIISHTEPGKDAIWLPLDPVFPVKLLLPELLKTAWDKDLIIFSGNPYHVQQGTLFALYPDYNNLGRQLVELALRELKEGDAVHHEPSRYLKSAINLRTASHLGIRTKNININAFDLAFPSRQR